MKNPGQRRLTIAEKEIRRHIDVWGADDLAVGTGAVQREQIEASLTDANSAYLRLRRVMDAWAALWFVPQVVPWSRPSAWIFHRGDGPVPLITALSF